MSDVPRNRVSVESTVWAALAAHKAGRMEEADRLYSLALAADSSNPAALHFAGLFALQRGSTDRAIDLLRRATAAAPHIAEAHNNLSAALRTAGHLDEALAAAREALRIQPGYFAATLNAVAALINTGQAADAVDLLRPALESRVVSDAEPMNYAAWSNLLMTMQYDAWQTPQTIAAAHRRFGELLGAAIGDALRPPMPADQPQRLCIGYVSPDFRDHAVISFFEPILRQHDRKRFEIICYADISKPDAVTARLRGLAERWCDVTGLSHADLAKKIAGDGVHLLIDLASHTTGNRLPMFARRPAPIQLAYLGYPATTGVSAIDYRITDSLSDPIGKTESLHTEQLARLPGIAWCYEPPKDAPEPTAPPEKFTFGCFTQIAKMNPALLELWARILQAVPDARLLLKSRGLEDPGTRRRWEGFFADTGIDPSRFELRGNSPSNADHLAAHNDVSVMLNTYPYHGTTTTCEALWMGLPVVTLAGESHLSRVGVSLLSAIGHREWIAESKEQYVEIAAALYHNREHLAALRRDLRTQMRQSPLLDAAAFTRDLEQLYEQLWAEHIAKAI